MGWTAEESGFYFHRTRYLIFTASRSVLKPNQSSIQWVLGVLSFGLKFPGRKPDHSFPSSAELNNVWKHTSTPLYAFMAWFLIKQRETSHLYLHVVGVPYATLVASDGRYRFQIIVILTAALIASLPVRFQQQHTDAVSCACDRAPEVCSGRSIVQGLSLKIS
jgi:hypothetical protein